MTVIQSGSQPFIPYARLMNILGDQLITNKIVAVIEIIKNSYDADATSVEVRFCNFANQDKLNVKDDEDPYIEIEDNGEGMNLEVIKDVWLRPATPNKFEKKRNSDKKTTSKGRIVQGEKGIGRFAIHKLGEVISLYTKALNSKEVQLNLNFTDYNPEKINLSNQGPTKYKLLSEINNEWKVNEPSISIKKPHGTLIRISGLRERWEDNDFAQLYQAIKKLVSPVDPIASSYFNINFIKDFDIKLFKDSAEYFASNTIGFEDIFERAQFKMMGSVISGEAESCLEKPTKLDQQKVNFEEEIKHKYLLNFKYSSSLTRRSVEKKIPLLASEYDLMSIRNFVPKEEKTSSKKENLSDEQKPKKIRIPKCGSFNFSLYAFDLAKKDRTIITRDVEDFVKSNSVYLFRDGVRVYPFGEKEYDWLELDKLRATYKASAFFSYNDLVGFVYISQEDNPLLMDASNRQGIMDVSGAYHDFRYLMLACAEIMKHESNIDKAKIAVKNSKLLGDTRNSMQSAFDALRTDLIKKEDTDTLKKAETLLKSVDKHVAIMRDRMDTYEGLAGLGMAVEKSSHDALMMLSRMRVNLKDFHKKASKQTYNNQELLELLSSLDENISFIYEEMQILQPLYKQQRKSITDVSVKDSAEKVLKYFRKDLEDSIKVTMNVKSDLVVKTNTGFILQVLINIIDNAIYWLKAINAQRPKEISISINGAKKELIIADSGNGIDPDLATIIFQEFFTQKSDGGRGLGLFIVKEILQRINAEIQLITNENKKILPGANFLITFND